MRRLHSCQSHTSVQSTLGTIRNARQSQCSPSQPANYYRCSSLQQFKPQTKPPTEHTPIPILNSKPLYPKRKQSIQVWCRNLCFMR
ncbi:hypothetical protein FKM82_016369 [Ascaphus truei]